MYSRHDGPAMPNARRLPPRSGRRRKKALLTSAPACASAAGPICQTGMQHRLGYRCRRRLAYVQVARLEQAVRPGGEHDRLRPDRAVRHTGTMRSRYGACRLGDETNPGVEI